MADEPALFDEAAYRIELPDPTPKLSPDRRRTQLQSERLAAGVHPLTGTAGHPILLHPDAPAAGDRDAPGPRCGSCWYRQVIGYHRRAYPKCLFPGSYGPDELERIGYPRVSHSTASDVRGWWPSCRDYSPGDGALSPDAARYIPEVVTHA